MCFNRPLGEWVRDQVQSDPTAAEYRHLLTVRNFHALADDLSKMAGLLVRDSVAGRERLRGAAPGARCRRSEWALIGGGRWASGYSFYFGCGMILSAMKRPSS